jgi:crossover junction endodeoxyribonuclease RuvC
MKVYLGVDPGLAGGFAAITADATVLTMRKMPHEPAAIVDFLLWLRRQAGDDIRAALEFVRSSPQQGVASAFTFGRGYGRLETALHACRITFDEVHPLRWQRLLDCRSGGDKNITKRRAIELFPEQAVTHANADALLLAEYRRRFGENILFHELTPTPASRLRSVAEPRGL